MGRKISNFAIMGTKIYLFFCTARFLRPESQRFGSSLSLIAPKAQKKSKTATRASWNDAEVKAMLREVMDKKRNPYDEQ
jgi:hypothetical protein